MNSHRDTYKRTLYDLQEKVKKWKMKKTPRKDNEDLELRNRLVMNPFLKASER
jgi:hypothetical protein